MIDSIRIACVAIVTACALTAQAPPVQAVWPNEVVEAFRLVPVQDGGRVKPLDALVQFAMYRIHGKRKMHVPDEPRYGALAGQPLDSMRWGLEVLLRPETARDLPSFTIANSDVLTVIGLSDVVRRKRDRYSYAELVPGIPTLGEKFRVYRQKDEERRTLVEDQVIALGWAVLEYQSLEGALGFAQARFQRPTVAADIFELEVLRASDVLRSAQRLMPLFRSQDEGARAFMESIEAAFSGGHALRLFPAADPEEETWLAPLDLYQTAVMEGATQAQIEAVEALEAVFDTVHAGEAELVAAAKHVSELTANTAAARGQYDGIGLEVAYYKFDFFYKALIGFLIGFLVLCASWLAPKVRLLPRIAFGVVGVTNLVLIAGVTVRCILRGRPPVLNLYDTVLFISAVIVTVGLLVEWINRKRIGLALATILGAIGMFLSFMHEGVDKSDTLAPPIAVLRTNFWLATHVTTVTIGYAAGILAGAIAWVFLLGKLFGLRRGDRAFYHDLTRMTYGAIAFGVVFSTVGTILGGIWANYSWGRFWGWDPKENGALMIVLWFLMTMHARLAGYIKQWGLALMAVLGSGVVAFSWWHVNHLGKGLHSYGKAEGVMFAVMTFYGITLLVFGLGVLAYFLEKRRAADLAAADADADADAEAAPA